jgi:protein SCO1
MPHLPRTAHRTVGLATLLLSAQLLASTGCQPSTSSPTPAPTTQAGPATQGASTAASATSAPTITEHPAASSPKAPLPALGAVGSFSLQNIDGAQITQQTLAGHPYIIDFMFTSCTDFCPGMTEKMGKVRKALGPESPIRTVSVSVDPERDGPDRLKSYATQHKAVDPRWYFLTGERKVIMRMMMAMHLASQHDLDAPNPKLHNTRFVLVDGSGQVRGYYTHDKPETLDRLLEDARALDGTAPPGGRS